MTASRRACERCSALEKALLCLSSVVAARSCRDDVLPAPDAPKLVSRSSEAKVPIPAGGRGGVLNSNGVLRVFVGSHVSLCSTIRQSWPLPFFEAFAGLCSLSRVLLCGLRECFCALLAHRHSADCDPHRVLVAGPPFLALVSCMKIVSTRSHSRGLSEWEKRATLCSTFVHVRVC